MGAFFQLQPGPTISAWARFTHTGEASDWMRPNSRRNRLRRCILACVYRPVAGSTTAAGWRNRRGTKPDIGDVSSVEPNYQIGF